MSFKKNILSVDLGSIAGKLYMDTIQISHGNQTFSNWK